MTSIKRPKNESVFAFHEESFDWNFFSTGSQFFFNSMLAPTGTPRYVKGNWLLRHPIARAILWSSISEIPIPNRKDLWKFTLRLEEIGKHLWIRERFWMPLMSQLPTKMTSSAYSKCEMVGTSWRSLTPWITGLMHVSLTATCRPSIARMKRNGDSRSPCLTPHEIGNSSFGVPFTRIDAVELDRQP